MANPSGIKGIHRVEKTLKSGEVRKYHYVNRGGPKFWDSTMPYGPEDPRYAAAFADMDRGLRVKAKTPSLMLTKTKIDAFEASAAFLSTAPRTQSDYRKYLKLFREEFGDDPIKMFEEREVMSDLVSWKNQWAHSPKQYDYAGAVVSRFLNWCEQEDQCILGHHHKQIKHIYKANRAEIIWLPEEIEALRAVATPKEARIVDAASEGGLTPQDIGRLTMDNVKRTPKGRRVQLRRSKTDRFQGVPVTPTLAALIDSTPPGQTFLVTSLTGEQLQPERASQIIRDLKARANARADETGEGIHIREELRLYDMRGTAATALLRAGCSLNEIAVSMGWGLRHAANIIEAYAALVPEVTDEVNKKLAKAKKKERKRAERSD